MDDILQSDDLNYLEGGKKAPLNNKTVFQLWNIVEANIMACYPRAWMLCNNWRNFEFKSESRNFTKKNVRGAVHDPKTSERVSDARQLPKTQKQMNNMMI